MDEPISVPMAVAGPYDSYWQDIVDWLKETGEIHEDDMLTELSIAITVDEQIEIVGYTAQRVP